MRMDRRREKSANYTRNEKHLLLDKALPFLEVIENKRTDTLTVEVKVRSWTQVASHYNAANPKAQRTVTQLKNLYENIKKRTKKDVLMYQAELKETDGKATFRKIDDICWRLIKTVPSLKILWKNTSLIKQKLLNKQEAPATPVEETETIVAAEMSPTPQTVDYSVVIKEEYLPDNQEFFTEEEIPEIEDLQNETQRSPNVNFESAQISENINDGVDEADMRFLQHGNPENSFGIPDSLYEMEKEIKKKELEKLNLDIQMKKLELEFMKGRLREQEINFKFRELEYEMKRKELDKP